MDKNKSNKLFFTALIVGSIVYLVKDIVFHEYKYWQCLNSHELAYQEYLKFNQIRADNVLDCVKIINKN